MGSPLDEVGRDEDEDQHEVTLTEDFEILSTEVTCEAFKTTMEDVYPDFEYLFDCSPCPGCPVTMVTWNQAAAYCNALSTQEGLQQCYDCDGPHADDVCRTLDPMIYDCSGYRLPTEAEWEYAARAGTTTTTFVGEADESGCVEDLFQYAWYNSLSCDDGIPPDRPQTVGRRLPNPWGLWDILGNVEEWCHDQYASYLADQITDPTGPHQLERMDTYHVARGGHHESREDRVRSANRFSYNSLEPIMLTTVGFRVARTAQ